MTDMKCLTKEFRGNLGDINMALITLLPLC